MFYERRCYRSLYSLHFFVSLLFRFVAAAAAAAAAAVVAVAAVVVAAAVAAVAAAEAGNTQLRCPRANRWKTNPDFKDVIGTVRA